MAIQDPEENSDGIFRAAFHGAKSYDGGPGDIRVGSRLASDGLVQGDFNNWKP